MSYIKDKVHDILGAASDQIKNLRDELVDNRDQILNQLQREIESETPDWNEIRDLADQGENWFEENEEVVSDIEDILTQLDGM